jgi:hypothetical protein
MMEFGVAVRCVVEGETSGVPGAVSRELLMVVRDRYELEAKALAGASTNPLGRPEHHLRTSLH